MGQIPFTTDQITKVIDGRFHSPIQDVTGDNYTTSSRLAVSAATEYDFECNGNVRNKKVLPSHITNIWDTSTNIATFGDFLNTPEMVFNVRFTFDPTVSAAGQITVRPYVNETVPISFKPVTVGYKAVADQVFALVTIYAGDETGFDVKNKGVFFKFESTGAGEMYDPSIEVYRT